MYELNVCLNGVETLDFNTCRFQQLDSLLLRGLVPTSFNKKVGIYICVLLYHLLCRLIWMANLSVLVQWCLFYLSPSGIGLLWGFVCGLIFSLWVTLVPATCIPCYEIGRYRVCFLVFSLLWSLLLFYCMGFFVGVALFISTTSLWWLLKDSSLVDLWFCHIYYWLCGIALFPLHFLWLPGILRRRSYCFFWTVALLSLSWSLVLCSVLSGACIAISYIDGLSYFESLFVIYFMNLDPKFLSSCIYYWGSTCLFCSVIRLIWYTVIFLVLWCGSPCVIWGLVLVIKARIIKSSSLSRFQYLMPIYPAFDHWWIDSDKSIFFTCGHLGIWFVLRC